MKKNNVIVAALMVLVSAFLLWLWYYLGLNEIDQPLDLVLSILWWCVVVAGLIFIARFEKTRRASIRTLYVGTYDGHAQLFNSEAGLMSYGEKADLQSLMRDTLSGLSYSFEKQPYPSEQQVNDITWPRNPSFDAVTTSGGGGSDSPFGPDSSVGQREGRDFQVAYVVTSATYSEDSWKGEVIQAKTGEKIAFDTKEELFRLVARLNASVT